MKFQQQDEMMIELKTKHGTIKIYTDDIDAASYAQILEFANSDLGENANIRIMPDVHAGIGCVIGTTLLITNKVDPAVVGVDIGCGVSLFKFDTPLNKYLAKIDEAIGKSIPIANKQFDPKRLICWNFLRKNTQDNAMLQLGTLGGGNHFIEAYNDGYLSVHSGSRGLGAAVAQHYIRLAQDSGGYLTGQNMHNYLHDMGIMQEYASLNRYLIVKNIANHLKIDFTLVVESVHNYIDLKHNILRKGAISAQLDEEIVIPLNMKEGLILAKGLGNSDWNFSAPHGCGRKLSRKDAKASLSLSDYHQTMKGIHAKHISTATLDEAPDAYKDAYVVLGQSEPTMKVYKHLIPIYNHKGTK